MKITLTKPQHKVSSSNKRFRVLVSGRRFGKTYLCITEMMKYATQINKKIWYVAPLASSIIGSVTDTFLFFSIAFYATGIPWVTLAFGDLAVKLFIALAMLIPFRLLIYKIKDFSESSVSEIKN